MRQSGDSDAEPEEPFGALVPPHLHAMLQTAAALVGAADAEDATQEAILRAWRAWDTLRDVAAVRGWLLRISIHICQDWQRGRFGTRRMRTVPLLDDDALPLADLGADPGASDPTGALDLRAAINTLPYDLRVVVALPNGAVMAPFISTSGDGSRGPAIFYSWGPGAGAWAKIAPAVDILPVTLALGSGSPTARQTIYLVALDPFTSANATFTEYAYTLPIAS